MLGPSVGPYLNAIAIRDDLISRDPTIAADLDNYVVDVVSARMMDGFEEAVKAKLASLGPEVARSFESAVVVNLRRRLVREITGHMETETIFEAFLRISDEHDISLREWVKRDKGLKYERRERDFIRTLRESLLETNLSTPDRIRCEHRISSAFYSFVAAEARDSADFARVVNHLKNSREG
jgi:hypothetical protein